MNTKEIVIYSGNVLLTIGAFVLVALGKITWEMALAFVAVMLMPSAAHVAVQRSIKKEEEEKK